MLALFNDYDDATRELLQSLRVAGVDVTPVVIRYDGELPGEALCPLTEYAGIRRTGRPLFFNEVPVPQWCEIRQGKQPYGEILRDGDLLGRIHYEPTSFRQVRSVEWLLPDGTVTHSDHYDRYGNHYATTHHDRGAAYQTVYRGDGEWEVEVNHVSRAVTLRSRDELLTFATLTDFVGHYLSRHPARSEERAEAQDLGPLINSLSYPLFVLRDRLPAPAATLFWQEPMPGDIPGNMALELENPRALRRIVFEDERLLRKVQAAYPDTAVELTYLSHLTPPRDRPDADPARTFTLTHTDDLPGLEQLLVQHPQVTFSVAALTQMSAKLHDLARRHPNLHLTPTITQTGIAEELARASIYLDIDAGRQVLDVVKAAYHLGLLVLAPLAVAKLPDRALTFPTVGDLSARLAAVTSDAVARDAALHELHTLRGPLSSPADWRALFAM